MEFFSFLNFSLNTLTIAEHYTVYCDRLFRTFFIALVVPCGVQICILFYEPL